jgi:molecular chaperone DnaJ
MIRKGHSTSRGAGFGGTRGFDFEDLSSVFGQSGGFGSFADIFSSIFGDRFGGFGASGGVGQSRGPVKGDDLYSEIEIPFSTAARGGKIKARVNMNESCSVCQGSGVKAGSSEKICPECNGRGMVSFMQGNFAVSRPCPTCLGRGKVSGEPCGGCRGAGTVVKRREISVNIPAGIEPGKDIRLKGLGNPGIRGGPAGDLYLGITIKDHPFFWREGSDIHCRLPLTLKQAANGTKIRVRTMSGKKVEMIIPPGTAAGSRFRLAGLGLALKGRRGDQIVEIDLKIPPDLSEEEKEMLERINRKVGAKA